MPSFGSVKIFLAGAGRGYRHGDNTAQQQARGCEWVMGGGAALPFAHLHAYLGNAQPGFAGDNKSLDGIA